MALVGLKLLMEEVKKISNDDDDLLIELWSISLKIKRILFYEIIKGKYGY